jgi:hypothetical protein
MKTKLRCVFDTKLKRPACVLLQAALGGDIESAHFFDSNVWLTAPTKDMRLFRTTREELRAVAKVVR